MIFDKGEIRSIGLKVKSKNGSQFVINTAEYVVSLNDNVVERGQCAIDGHDLIILFHADEKGRHKVTFKYTIAEETLIDEIIVEVI